MPTPEQFQMVMKHIKLQRIIRKATGRKKSGEKKWNAWLQLTPDMLPLIVCPECLERLYQSLGGSYVYFPSKRKAVVQQRREKIKELLREGKSKKEITEILNMKLGTLYFDLHKIAKKRRK